MPARRLRPRNEEKSILFDRSVDRVGTRLSGNVDREIREPETARQSRLPPRRSSFDRFRRWIITDEILLADECVDRRIDRRRCRADLLSVALDEVIKRCRLKSQRDLGQLLCLAPGRIASKHHRHAAQPEGDDDHRKHCALRLHGSWLPKKGRDLTPIRRFRRLLGSSRC